MPNSSAATLEQEVDLPYLQEEIPRAIEQSFDGVAGASKIVPAMKGFSHPGAAEKTPANISEAIETTITVARNEWKYATELVTDVDPSLPLVPCPLGEFNQVMLNLITNAADAIADVVGDGGDGRGTITVTTRRDDGWVEIRVRRVPHPIRRKGCGTDSRAVNISENGPSSTLRCTKNGAPRGRRHQQLDGSPGTPGYGPPMYHPANAPQKGAYPALARYRW